MFPYQMGKRISDTQSDGAAAPVMRRVGHKCGRKGEKQNMSKEKKYYLIAQYCTVRGQSLEHPACYIHGLYHELRDIDPEDCYTSEKRAQNYADKLNGSPSWRYGWRHKVIHVPSEALRTQVVVK